MQVILLIATLFQVSGLSIALQGSPVVEREYVLQDFLDHMPTNSFSERAWVLSEPMGDVNRDNKSDFMLLSNQMSLGMPTWSTTPWFMFGLNSGLGQFPSGNINQRVYYSNGPTKTLSCILNSPTGFRLLAFDRQTLDSSGIWEIPSGQFVARLGPPTPPPGKPPILAYANPRWAGDINHDGWDDFFFQAGAGHANSWSVTGLVDGQTGDLIWQDYQKGYFLNEPVSWAGAGLRPDLNGDGTPDFVSGFSLGDLWGWKYSISAYSGLDGTVLWRDLTDFSGYENNYPALVSDLNGDGVADVVTLRTTTLGGDFFVVAMDGTTGAYLWTAIIDQLIVGDFPSSAHYQIEKPLMASTQLGDPGKVNIGVHFTWTWAARNRMESMVLFLDGATGAKLETIPTPNDLMPWMPDDITRMTNTVKTRLGDPDGDGLEEFLQFIPLSPGHDLGLPLYPTVGAIFGLRTWFIPSQAHLGEVIQPVVSIPSSPGHNYKIVFSTALATRRNWKPQGWRTILADNATLRQSLSNPALRGRLDANGESTHPLTIPSRPQLVGTTLYSQVLVEDPQLSGKIKTMSTMGQTEILP